jgi:glycine cleavage system H protein
LFQRIGVKTKRKSLNEHGKLQGLINMTEEVRDGLKYTDSHEWVKVKGSTALVGITDHAQSELTDIVFVELPDLGKEVKKGDELCVVESVKSVSEIYAPVSGKITKINSELDDSPEIINKSPYDKGWLVEIEVRDKKELDSLLDVEAYKNL